MNANLSPSTSFLLGLEQKIAALAERDGVPLAEVRESEFMQLFIALAVEGMDCAQTADWTPQSAQRFRDLYDRVAALEPHPAMFLWCYFAQSNTGERPPSLSDEVCGIFEPEKP